MLFKELLKEAADGDEQALGTLYRIYQPLITKMSMPTIIWYLLWRMDTLLSLNFVRNGSKSGRMDRDLLFRILCSILSDIQAPHTSWC